MTSWKALLVGGACWLCSAGIAWAQPAPTITTTLQTTDTSTTSIKVGCAIGSGTCTGGINGGPIAATLIALSSGYVEIQSFVPASQTNRLVNNGGTLQWNGSSLAVGGAVGPGTSGALAVFTGATSIANSIITQSGATATVANTLNATSLGGTLTTGSQPNITGVGTITSGTWQGSKVGLAFGGTNADLSGTGGTSQFLRQNSLGATVTVVRPATADLSDVSNVCLLTINCAFGAGGTIQFTANVATVGADSIEKNAGRGLLLQAGTGSSFDFAVMNSTASADIINVPTGTLNINFGGLLAVNGSGDNVFAGSINNNQDIRVSNGSGGASASAFVGVRNDLGAGADGFFQILSSGFTGTLPANVVAVRSTTNAGLALTSEGSGGITFRTTGSQTTRWGVNSNGDWTIGTANDIAMSNGTPSVIAGGGTGATVSGKDFAMFISTGSTASTGITVGFGHTYPFAPVCTGTPNTTAMGVIAVASSGSSVGFTYTSVSNATIHVHCINAQ